MSKRPLTVRNRNDERPMQSSVVTRSAAKRANTNETVLNPKKKTKRSDESKENQPESVNKKTTESLDSHLFVNDDDDDDDDETNTDYPSTSLDDYHEHPSNKEYLVYPLTNGNSLILSKTAHYWNKRYIKVLNHVNPDRYGMYIHADFSSYGELEVVENCLMDLTMTIFVVSQGFVARMNFEKKPKEKVNYTLGFRRLEALTILLNHTDGISNIDDGDRFYDIMRVIGACYVTILRGLLPSAMFTQINTTDRELLKILNRISKRIPNFKYVLEQSLIVGHNYLNIADIFSAYTSILRTVYLNWVFLMENQMIDPNSPPNRGNEKLWKALKQAADIAQNGIDTGGRETFDFMSELQSYRRKYPYMGGDSHDISKWSKSEREAYSFSRDRFENFWFF